MANKLFKDMIVVIDNASGSTARITSYVNNASVQGTLNLLTQAGLDKEEDTFLPGLAGGTIPLNGWVNSTTAAIFGPLIGNRTSVSKTWGLNNGIKWFTGEAWPEDVQLSGASGELQTWSCTLRLEGVVTYNSTAPS